MGKTWVTWGVLLSASFATAHEFSPEKIDIQAECRQLFAHVPASVVLHDEVIAAGQSERLAELHETLKRLLASSETEFSASTSALREFPEFFVADQTFSRENLVALDRSLVLLRALIHFQSDFRSAYETWVGQIELKKEAGQRTDEKPQLKEPTIGGKAQIAWVHGKSHDSWIKGGAQKAFAQIERDLLSLPQFRDLGAVRPDSHHHPHLPEFFASWLRTHASTASFYRVKPSLLMHELHYQLDQAYNHELSAH